MANQSARRDPVLWWAVGIAVFGLTVLAVLAAASYLFCWDGFWRGAGSPYATVIAALAAVVAAAIALHNSRSQLVEMRAQRDQDQQRWVDERDQDQQRWADEKHQGRAKDLRGRFTEATRLLADPSPTVRRSGAYAMVALADDWNDLGDQPQEKICIGVLAAYVTTPNPTHSFGLGVHDAGDDGSVRALIVALLSKHFETHPQQDLWGNYTLLHFADLRGVVFTAPINHVDLFRAEMMGANLTRAPYLVNAGLQRVDLTGANLSGVNLQDATLTSANLLRATISGNLCGANLRFAENLASAAIDNIVYDDDTEWPDGFTPPPPPHGYRANS